MIIGIKEHHKNRSGKRTLTGAEEEAASRNR
jgi:hypothetical protein